MAKQVREFLDQTEGIMAKDYLIANGVMAELEGVREYASYVVGGTQGRYSLMVEETDLEKAVDLLRRSQIAVIEKHEPQTETSSVAFRRSVSFAFLAMLLIPWIGNYISIREALKYARMKPRQTSTSIFIMVISVLQLPGAVLGLFLMQQALEALGFGAK